LYNRGEKINDYKFSSNHRFSKKKKRKVINIKIKSLNFNFILKICIIKWEYNFKKTGKSISLKDTESQEMVREKDPMVAEFHVKCSDLQVIQKFIFLLLK
jgi:hypothetical protein